MIYTRYERKKDVCDKPIIALTIFTMDLTMTKFDREYLKIKIYAK